MMMMSHAEIRSAEMARAASSPQLAARLALELAKFLRNGNMHLERNVIVLEPGMRVERKMDPTYISNSDALRTNHPYGAFLKSNRWSGSFLDMVGFGGAYFGFAGSQEPKHAAALASLKLGLFGVEAEMAYYIRQPGPGGAPSALDAGLKRHGPKRLPNGEINPLLGMSGSYIVRYNIERPVRLMHVDFADKAFLDMFETVSKHASFTEMLPPNVSLAKLLTSEETRGIHLLYRAVATALRQKGDHLRIEGIVSSSFRAAVKEGKRQAKVVCIWGKDGEVLQQLRPVSVSYFNFDGAVPKEVYTLIGPDTDYFALRRRAMG